MTEVTVDLNSLFSLTVDYSFKHLKIVIEKLLSEQEECKKNIHEIKINRSTSDHFGSSEFTEGNRDYRDRLADIERRLNIQENDLSNTKGNVNQLQNYVQSHDDQIREHTEKINSCLIIK